MKRYRVEMSGDLFGTKVFDLEGNEMKGIRSVRIEHVAGKVPTLTLEILLPILQATLPPAQMIRIESGELVDVRTNSSDV